MLKYNTTGRVIKDFVKSGKGLLHLNIANEDLAPFIGQDFPCTVLVDDERAHNPKEHGKLIVEREAPGIYKVNDHKLTFRPRFTCDCEFYQFSKGDIPCKHLVAVMKQMVAEKKF